MMRRLPIALLTVIGLTLVGCTPPPQPTSSALPPPIEQPMVSAKTGTLSVAAPSASLDDVSFWMALDALRQQGYVVETIDYARFDLVVTGLGSGEVDIAPCSHQTAWAAIAKGAPLTAIVDARRNPYVIATKAEIASCADLQGRSIAYSTTTNVLAALADGYLKVNCPGTEPQITVIPSSSNRMASLLSEVVDGALLDEEDALRLEREAPGKFHVLRYLAEEFPLVDTGAFYVNSDFAAERPDMVRDFVLAVTQAHRRVQDLRVLREEIERYVPGDADALLNADAYLAHQAWDVNGGLEPERLRYTLTFLTDAGVVPSGLQVEQLADWSYLNAVLDEIGRE